MEHILNTIVLASWQIKEKIQQIADAVQIGL